MHYPSEDHMNAVTQILRYLKGTIGKGIMFSKNGHLEITRYTDADWVGNISDRKSTSNYFTFVGGNRVTWRSKKQKVVALSSAEAEFRGMAKGLCELLWFRKLLTEIGFPPSCEMNLLCDNKTTIDIAYAASVVSQFMYCLSKDHMNAMTQILRYLKGTLGKGIML